jgi:S-adenosylmethionine synthetase
MFIAGGPNGDNGLSGKKLVVDAYGPTVPIGGGAWSGKDLNKVDRLGGYLARDLAVQAVARLNVREAVVTLEYIPGCDAPVHAEVLADGRSVAYTLDPVATGNAVITARLVESLPALPEMARWGHQGDGRIRIGGTGHG